MGPARARHQPCLGIRKNLRNNVARFLDTYELARLGCALDAREAKWPEAVAAIRLLALTGCRRSEVLDLRWRAVCEDAQLGSLRLHDLRHTTASQAVMSGENLPLVGKLLGHRQHRTTAGYAHVADGHLVEVAETVGGIIATAMAGADTVNR